MRHFLAYGNSDQESFRMQDVLDTFQVITVPGTIAAFYEEATAGFILTTSKPYIIDPRTPLLQGEVGTAKASHLSLSSWLGGTFASHVAESSEGLSVPASFLSPQMVAEMARELTSRQREYGQHAHSIGKKLDRYRRLRAIAQHAPEPQQDPVHETRPPEHILAPYFAAANESDPWWDVCENVWGACRELEYGLDVSPVVAVTNPEFLETAMSMSPQDLDGTSFFWLTGFDERRASGSVLRQVMSAVASGSDGRAWVNLYGGFFSICLGHWGLNGFSNGLGYSESRDWPELASTGAAPPRYYLRALHAFASPAVAQLLIDNDEWFGCDCRVCVDRLNQIADLGYHELKQHFALARAWEVKFVESSTAEEISTHLREVADRLASLADQLPSTLLPRTSHLDKWANVLETGPF